jgi:hypothetical protein
MFKKLFEDAVETAFTVFSSLLKDGMYLTVPEESGWGTDVPPVESPMVVIVNGLTQKDKENTSFFTQILSSDTIIMAKGADLRKNSVEVSSSDKFKILFGEVWKTFNIVAHETDPAEALYLLLLRQKGK